MTKKPFFSIVIPTLNEEKYLPFLLNDLAKQTYGRENFEVIHVDGSSEDKTREVAAKFAKKYPEKGGLNLHTLTTKKRNVSTQRNLGSKKAKGEWVIFMDADNRLDDYFLDGMKYQLSKHPHCDVFTTWTKAFEPNQKNLVIMKTMNFTTELYKLIGKPGALGALIGIRKTLTKKLVFDESQQVYEDTLFIKNVVENGYSYHVFQEPGYYYSLRRLHKEGTLRLAGKGALLSLRYLQGKEFVDQNFGYEMQGGTSYEEKTQSYIFDLRDFLKTASQKQLLQAKKLLQSLKELQV